MRVVDFDNWEDFEVLTINTQNQSDPCDYFRWDGPHAGTRKSWLGW